MPSTRQCLAIVFFVAAAVSLGLGFRSNLWGLADQRQFERQNFNMEAHVVGRLVKSRQDGPLSSGGLLGLGSEDGQAIDWWDVPGREQFDVYLRGGRFANFEVYASQPGVQGQLFSILDRTLDRPPADRLELYRTITAVLGGVALALVVTWFFLEFGAVTGVVVLVSTLASPWLTVFGGKMFWALWAFFLPLLVPMYFLRTCARPTRTQLWLFGGATWLAMFTKTLLNGYEYITTVLIMSSVPVVYHGMRHRWDRSEWQRVFAVSVAACALAVAASLALLIVQIAAARGGPLAGLEHIVESLRKRTYADPAAFSPGLGLEASARDVLMLYLKGIWLDLNDHVRVTDEYLRWYVLKVRYAVLIAAFGAASLVLYFQGRRADHARRTETTALLGATWFSLLAPLSWFIIFKSHSSIHVGMNQIVWHMPYVLFGFAVVGQLATRLIDRIRS